MKLKKSKNIFLSELNNFEPKIPTFRNILLINELSNREYSKKINKKILGLSNNNSSKEKNQNLKRPLTTTSSSNKHRNKKKYKTNQISSNYTSFLSQSKEIIK